MAEQKLLKGNDGFYVGRVLKNGQLSKDTYKISDTEIALMFGDYLRRYCERNNTNVLMAYRRGKMAYEALLHDENGKFVPKK